MRSPRSISAPPETRSLQPTRSQGDADETLRCLQPDLPLARRLCSPTVKAFRNVCVCVFFLKGGQLGAALFRQNQPSADSVSPLSSHQRRLVGVAAAAAAPARRTNQFLLSGSGSSREAESSHSHGQASRGYPKSFRLGYSKIKAPVEAKIAHLMTNTLQQI